VQSLIQSWLATGTMLAQSFGQSFVSVYSVIWLSLNFVLDWDTTLKLGHTIKALL
jgi:hypothetical protein